MENYRIEPIPEPAVPEQSKGSSALRFVVDILETVLLSAVLFLAINAVSARIRVDGSSMLPTLENGEFVIVNRLAYKLGSPQHGDVIVFRFPRDPEQEYIKRVIGLPGDRVKIMDGLVYVNDELIDEPYIAASPNYQSEWLVPEEALFVLGDNRNNSSDSHNWGPVPLQYVVGRALLIYWPPQNWGIIKHAAAG
ncbi:MAG: signal peptidase I [Anaerolineales bacterium]|nr:signal peptidase I [Anaerolineales bacterium]